MKFDLCSTLISPIYLLINITCNTMSKSFIFFGFFILLGLSIYVDEVTSEELEKIKTSSKVWLIYEASKYCHKVR